MGLNFVASVVVNGDFVAKLDKKDVDSQTKNWEDALVVYVVGQNPTLTSLSQYVNVFWHLKYEPAIFKHEEGFFTVKLNTKEDRDRVLLTGPHLFYGKEMIVNKWCANFNFHEEILKVVPVWVKFPNLPLSCWGGDSLSRIGSILVVPLFTDECTSKGLCISFARVLVEVDVTQKLQDAVIVEEPNGKCFTQKVIYIWLPPFCKKCCKVGHNCEVNSEGRAKTKVIQKWVPKKVNVATTSSNVEVPISRPIEVPVQKIAEEGETEVVITPVATPVNVGAEPEEGGAWKVVTRKTKDKGKRDT
ncbi:uncharacterized protein LOC125494751 [Beta vulgaris subsp. vulgaris]|uniref:uncharacterized protein LOC125494751 n=1 Tax=Beta vulgaris subsp. vulgaris TaxID=3555 RepID=UPI0020367AAE|nr:uncharacterized protein LOC125494751 [Beta vulgaris subsp. vulgaris]